jgi:FkbM family methyltransferase
MSAVPLRTKADKAIWGLRRVGPIATVPGLLRYAALRIRRPASAEITLRGSGIVLWFRYPEQLAPMLVVFGDVVDPEYEFLRRVSRPDWTVIDVGAGIGQFAVYAARHTQAVVHAFEPSGANVVVLAANARRNGVEDRLTVHQVALSDHTGTSSFSTGASTFVSHLVDAPTGDAGETVPVDTLTRSCMRLGLRHVSLIKINVAGAEPEVIAGAEAFLERAGADMLILLLGVGSMPWYARLRRFGYGMYFFDPDHMELVEVAAGGMDAILATRPTPARHAILIHDDALERTLQGTVTVRRSTGKRTSS